MAKSLKSGQKIGHYRLIEQVGRGGMAEVFRAENQAPGEVPRIVAVKRLFAKLAGDRAFVQMFVNEARIASTLRHPNLVRTFDLINTGGTYFIVMEYLDGCDLEDLVARAQPGKLCMSLPEILHVVCEVARGLDYAHRGGDNPENGPVVHRDISPGNILLDVNGQVKITDFGIARASLQSRHTQPGVLKGKYEFMAPEYVARGECDGRSDLFSLGVVFYEMLTGQNPFVDVLPRDTWKNIVERQAPQAASLVGGVSPEVDRVLAWMMRKDPAERCQDGQSVVDALEPLYAYAGAAEAARVLGLRVRRQLEPVEDRSFSEFLPDDEGPELVDATQNVRERDLIDLLGSEKVFEGESLSADSMSAEPTTPSIRTSTRTRLRRRWLIPLAILLVLASGASAAWLLWPEASGKLSVVSDRRAEVFVDERPLGLAPVSELPLPVGEYVIEVRRPGSQRVKRYERELAEDQHLTLDVRWVSPKKGQARSRTGAKAVKKPRRKTRSRVKKKPGLRKKVSSKKKTSSKKTSSKRVSSKKTSSKRVSSKKTSSKKTSRRKRSRKKTPATKLKKRQK